MATGDDPLDALVQVIAAESIIAARYEVPRPVGNGQQGHFSLTFRARDRETGQDVVLKFLRPGVDSYRAECFGREVTVAKALRGRDNVIQLTGGPFEHSITVRSTGGLELPFPLQFAAYECATRDFGRFLWSTPSPGLERRLEVVRDIVKGVNRLHNAGYCHRDLKPENVFLVSGGAAKVGDFGTCRPLASTDAALRDDYQGPVGDLAYVAPELLMGQWNDKELFRAADWFSVGCILFEAAAGMPLYTAIGLTGQISDIVHTFRALDETQRKSAFLTLVADIAGIYPLPRIHDFAVVHQPLASASSPTLDAVDVLVRALCHFDYRRRQTAFDRILRGLDIALGRAAADRRQRERAILRGRM